MRDNFLTSERLARLKRRLDLVCQSAYRRGGLSAARRLFNLWHLVLLPRVWAGYVAHLLSPDKWSSSGNPL